MIPVKIGAKIGIFGMFERLGRHLGRTRSNLAGLASSRAESGPLGASLALSAGLGLALALGAGHGLAWASPISLDLARCWALAWAQNGRRCRHQFGRLSTAWHGHKIGMVTSAGKSGFLGGGCKLGAYTSD